METEETPLAATGGGEEADMQNLMANKEFLESVLSSLPGVNPEEALQNLREMTGETDEENKEEKEEEKKKVNTLFIIIYCIGFSCRINENMKS